MKKSLYLGIIALAAMTMTSCENDDFLEGVPQKSAIQFGTDLGRDVQGRATVLDNTNLNDFGVFAYYTGQNTFVYADKPNFMFNQEVARTKTGETWGNWSYSPVKYWPTTKNDKISFFAYAPYEGKMNGAIKVVSTNDNAGVPKIKYTINPAYLTEAEDFTTDVLVDEVRSGDNNSIDSQDRGVNFSFRHELTRVGIKAKLDRDAFINEGAAHKTMVNVKKIEFGGTAFATEATYSFDVNDNQRGSWELGSQNATLDIANLLNTTNAPFGETNGYQEFGIRLYDDDQKNLFIANHYLFLIPTNGVNGTNAAGDVTITVSYDIVTWDASLKEGHSVTPAVKRFYLPEEALAQGKAYNYIFTFGLNEIKLSASVLDWDSELPVYDDVDWTIADVPQN